MKIEIKRGKELSKKFIKIFDEAKQKEFGSSPIKNFSKYHRDIFFIIAINKKVMSFGMLKRVKITYLKKNYEILGIANIISLKKKRGYGKILMTSMIDYLKKKHETALGFTSKPLFYSKCGLKIKKNLTKKFEFTKLLERQKKETIKRDPHIVYYEGRNKIIEKILMNKSKIITEYPW
jgi:hypothetical protein